LSWQTVTVLSVLILAIAVCGIFKIIDPGHVALSLATVLAWLIPSPIPGKPNLPPPGDA